MLKTILQSALVAAGILAVGESAARKLQIPSPKLSMVAPNADGARLYFVLLRADYVAELGDAGEAPPVNPRDVHEGDDPRAWHRADARKMVRLLENEYRFSATAMTSWIAPSMTVYLSDAQLEALDNDVRVDKIEAVTQSSSGESDFSATPPWSNNTSGSDYISYGKIAMDVNDNVTPSNKVYMVDAGISADGLAHQDLDAGNISQPWHSIADCTSSPQHSTAVASVLAAEHNTIGVKGVNNASPVISVRKGCTHVDLPNALDYVVADLETNGQFAVVSLSANSTSYADGTIAAQYIRKASARALFVQSAGNQGNVGGDACTYAYSPNINGDGILVVGAVDENGDVVANFDQSGVGGGAADPGSNSGSCAEVWAPGQRIWIDWPDFSHTARFRWSGTSFAAPYISALASRYGNTSTNP